MSAMLMLRVNYPLNIIRKIDGRWWLQMFDASIRSYVYPAWGPQLYGAYGCKTKREIVEFLSDLDFVKTDLLHAYFA